MPTAGPRRANHAWPKCPTVGQGAELVSARGLMGRTGACAKVLAILCGMTRRKHKPSAAPAPTPRRRPVVLWLAIPVGLLLGIAILTSFGNPQADVTTATEYSYEIVNSFPHDPNAFCQGLVIKGSTLYESTGKYGESSLRRVNLTDGVVQQQIDLHHQVFAEGLAMVDDQLFQLTWKRQIGFVYDAATLQLLRTFTYDGEGWGLTYDGQHLIMSNGSDELQYREPESFGLIRRLRVKDGSRSVRRLNELEFVQGKIYANVWRSQRVAMIDPETGQVTGWIRLTGLLRQPITNENVLNGIAYDSAGDRLFVTGKHWPTLFEVRLLE